MNVVMKNVPANMQDELNLLAERFNRIVGTDGGDRHSIFNDGRKYSFSHSCDGNVIIHCFENFLR